VGAFQPRVSQQVRTVPLPAARPKSCRMAFAPGSGRYRRAN
jgi:hypothetical protein